MSSDAGFDVVARLNGPHTYGRTCIYKVTNAQRHITRDVADDFIHRKEHIFGKTSLAHLAIEFHLELQVLHISTQLLKRHKLIRQGLAISL